MEIPATDLVFPGQVLCVFLCALISLTGGVKLLCFVSVVTQQQQQQSL